MNDLDALYRQVIMDHYKKPRNKGDLSEQTGTIELNNPSCGDRIELGLKINDNIIESVKFTGSGCSISMASASMMTEAVKGKSINEAKSIINDFLQFMQGNEVEWEYEDIEALHGVVKFPTRIKCATLAWKALEEGISNK